MIPRLRRMRRRVPKHRRPPPRGLLRHRAGAALAAGGVLAAAFGIGGWALAGRPAGYGRAGSPGAAGPTVPVPHSRDAGHPGQAGQRLVARPVRLVIPAIGVRTHLTRLGLTAARTMQVPASPATAGWFTGSPRPGAIGSSVIAGHIDSVSGPGVFYRLRTMRHGERIYVVRADRSTAVFRVIAVRRYPKDRFPAARVFGPVPDAELRLITCGGLFDYATRSYLSNVVVYAVLAHG